MATKAIKYKLNQAVVDKIEEKAVDFTGGITQECVDVAKTLAPTDTGKLSSSIRILSKEDKDFSFGSDVGYAKMVEFGTRYQMAQPYLRPSIDVVKQRHAANSPKNTK